MSHRYRQRLCLENGSRVGVVGGGPAGSFFGLFLLSLAERVGIDLRVDIYEPRDFSRPGPVSCNMCGGIVSESLVQDLALEGINLPFTVVQRGLNSYVLHMDVGTVRIEPARPEKRIASVHRGSGPRGQKDFAWQSLDGFLQKLAVDGGARVIPRRVSDGTWHEGRPQVAAGTEPPESYDLLAVAAGGNTSILSRFEGMDIGYDAPETMKTYVMEFSNWGTRS